MKQIEKGCPGYLGQQKKKKGILVVASLLVIVGIVVAGFWITHTRNNVFTIIAAVLVLPFAKIFVGFLMLCMGAEADTQLIEALKAADSRFLHKYDCVLTTKNRVVSIPALVITQSGALVYAPKLTDAASKETVDEMVRFARNENVQMTVLVYVKEPQFVKAAARICQSRTDLSEEDIAAANSIWEVFARMCL